jgi:hypothetical protein
MSTTRRSFLVAYSSYGQAILAPTSRAHSLENENYLSVSHPRNHGKDFLEVHCLN